MFGWIFALDPTVQVALIGVLGAALAGIFGIARAILSPKTDEHQKEYGPKPTLVMLSDGDRAIFNALIKSVDDHADAIERHRIELDRRP
jgi:hypothetical protein